MKRNIFILTLCTLVLLPVWGAKRKIHTIGDSTMSEYQPAATPKRGWGMYLQAFFNPDSVEVNNRGKSGASTRTFYETESLWPSVKAQMNIGDYLIIQFAHNDEKCKGEDVFVKNRELRAEGKDTLTDMRGTDPNTTYKEYLRKYVNEAREKGVFPILMSPICRAYFKDGKIDNEGRHMLSFELDYVRAMNEVAIELNVPFLDMTSISKALYEKSGQSFCMSEFFNCGDKTHTGMTGGMTIAKLAYELINKSPELKELGQWLILPTIEKLSSYAQNIEERGKRAAIKAKGTPFSCVLVIEKLQNMEKKRGAYVPTGGLWPAGEIDEVANRYIEYSITAEKKKGLVIETIALPVRAKGGEGMNIHINYGFGDKFKHVTTIYENTALPKNKKVEIQLDQPILVPAGQTLHIRILPWYDSNGKPQKGKRLEVGEMKVTGKNLK